VPRVVTAVSRQPVLAKVSPPQILNGPAGQVVGIEVFPDNSPPATATTTLILHLRSGVIPRAEAGSVLRICIGGDTATFADFPAQLDDQVQRCLGVELGRPELDRAVLDHEAICPHLAVRPEDLEIIAAVTSDTPPDALRGVIEAALYVGERVEYQIQVEEQQKIVAYGDRHNYAPPGASVWLKPRPNGHSVWVGDF
jgi:hypothetical protein